MKLICIISILLCIPSIFFADIPLSNSPTWNSMDSDFSTGGALYDITMDGWIDYCTGNGNDMESNTNAIYINQSGILETDASWRSHETRFFSHIYVGDVDNDGFPDMAVSYLGFDVGLQGPASIYRNEGTGLDSIVWWTSADHYNSFDCAFGDVDLDGDLDLAVAAGDAYNDLYEPTRVYRNNSGIIETTPYWTSVDSSPGDACRWVDLDNDGFLDLIVGYRHKLAAFKNNNGTLEDTAFWSTVEPGWILRIAVGDYNNDGYKDIAVASNGQLDPGASRIEIYKNETGILQTPPEYIMLTSSNYCSCVEWGDANNDGWLDLAAGGWWEPALVFENNSGTIDTTPAWSWDGGYSLVCETVMWGDIGNRSLDTISDYKSGDGVRKLFYFDHHPIQFFQEVRVNDTPIPLSDFTFDYLTGWISFKNAPASGTDNIKIKYAYSKYPDLGVTNWTENVGNYLFSNTAPGIHEEQIVDIMPAKLSLTILPNPFSVKTQIVLSSIHGAERIELNIYDVSGRLVKIFSVPNAYSVVPTIITWNGSDNSGRKLPNGIYFVEANVENNIVREKIVIVK